MIPYIPAPVGFIDIEATILIFLEGLIEKKLIK